MTVENGVIEIKVDDKTIGFKFGTYTFKIIRELTGIETIEEVFKKLTVSNNAEFIVSFVQACAIHYAKEKKQEHDFSELEVAGWIDEMGLVASRLMITELIKAYTAKNLPAPVTGQLAEQQ
jgi:hypothetical protein